MSLDFCIITKHNHECTFISVSLSLFGMCVRVLCQQGMEMYIFFSFPFVYFRFVSLKLRWQSCMHILQVFFLCSEVRGRCQCQIWLGRCVCVDKAQFVHFAKRETAFVAFLKQHLCPVALSKSITVASFHVKPIQCCENMCA